VTLVEFADPQCPYCAQWSGQAFPELVRDYVRPGKVRIIFAGLAFIGPDSDEALRFALAAGRQGKLWQVMDLLYANQGAENSGWVSQDVLREIGDAVPGLDVERALRETQSQEVESQLAAAKDLQARLGVRSTPAFAASRAGGQLAPVQVTSLDAGGITPSLDRLLAR
jgi:protein-disulfide isomerase